MAELARADQVARVVLQRRVHGDEIGARQGDTEVSDRLAAHRLDLGRRIGRIDTQALQAERVQRLRQTAADTAEANDQHRALADVLSLELQLAHVVAAAHVAVDIEQPLGQRQHQGKRVLDHRRRVGEANGRHHHAVVGGGRDVDVVAANAVPGDDLEVGRCLDQRARDLGQPHAQRLGARQEVGPSGRVRVVRHDDLEILARMQDLHALGMDRLDDDDAVFHEGAMVRVGDDGGQW